MILQGESGGTKVIYVIDSENLKGLPIEELQKLLDTAVQKEYYEFAAAIRDIIKARTAEPIRNVYVPQKRWEY
jgi:protein-arginine kinase activator protein McsA